MFLVLETLEICGQTRKHCFRNKNVSKFVGKHFCFLGSQNFVSATMFHEVGKQGNIDRKHNLSATMFPTLPRALGSSFKLWLENILFLLLRLNVSLLCKLSIITKYYLEVLYL